MKNFGHKYDGAQEQEQMLNMLNIGLGAFLLYLFHKNFGKKMSGGGVDNKDGYYEFTFTMLTILGIGLFFAGVSMQDLDEPWWLVAIFVGLTILIFLLSNPLHTLLGEVKKQFPNEIFGYTYDDKTAVYYAMIVNVLLFVGMAILLGRNMFICGAVVGIIALYILLNVHKNIRNALPYEPSSDSPPPYLHRSNTKI